MLLAWCYAVLYQRAIVPYMRWLPHSNVLLPVLLLSLGFVGGAGFAQAKAQEPAQSPATATGPATAVTPKDSGELLDSAAASNGLNQSDMKPWHLRLSFKVLDESGQPQNQGTIEETWVGEQKYKVVYKGTAFALENYGTPKGRMTAGATGNSPAGLDSILAEFVSPFPMESIRKRWTLDAKERQTKGANLMCLTVTAISMPDGSQKTTGPLYCLDEKRPVLRISESASSTYLHNNTQTFDGHYIPADVLAVRNGKVTMQAHLEAIEEVSTVIDADLAPPADAVLPARIIAVSSGVAAANLIKGVEPVYPVLATSGGVEGTVVIHATIDKDGHTSDLSVISGPDELKQAALDAVKQWVYRPYLLNGAAVTIQTLVSIVFRRVPPRSIDPALPHMNR